MITAELLKERQARRSAEHRVAELEEQMARIRAPAQTLKRPDLRGQGERQPPNGHSVSAARDHQTEKIDAAKRGCTETP